MGKVWTNFPKPNEQIKNEAPAERASLKARKTVSCCNQTLYVSIGVDLLVKSKRISGFSFSNHMDFHILRYGCLIFVREQPLRQSHTSSRSIGNGGVTIKTIKLQYQPLHNRSRCSDHICLQLAQMTSLP